MCILDSLDEANFFLLTNGADWTGPRPDGPAIGSVKSTGSDEFGLVAIKPLDVEVHVDVVVTLL